MTDSKHPKFDGALRLIRDLLHELESLDEDMAGLVEASGQFQHVHRNAEGLPVRAVIVLLDSPEANAHLLAALDAAEEEARELPGERGMYQPLYPPSNKVASSAPDVQGQDTLDEDGFMERCMAGSVEQCGSCALATDCMKAVIAG